MGSDQPTSYLVSKYVSKYRAFVECINNVSNALKVVLGLVSIFTKKCDLAILAHTPLFRFDVQVVQLSICCGYTTNQQQIEVMEFGFTAQHCSLCSMCSIYFLIFAPSAPNLKS